jgi:hypothetical protein
VEKNPAWFWESELLFSYSRKNLLINNPSLEAIHPALKLKIIFKERLKG